MEASGTDRMLRVVILSGAAPRLVARLVAQIHRDVPEARVCGILYHALKSPGIPKRIRNFIENLPHPGYVGYVARRILAVPLSAIQALGRWGLRFLHASFPRSRAFGWSELQAYCRAQGCTLSITSDVHAAESLEYVRGLRPDLGIVFGTPILKPMLFEIPRLGSINLHQRKVPDYRGSGPIGLWEMLDGQKEIGVTVHRVLQKLDAGGVIRSTTIPIEPFDTIRSLGMKAHVVGIDLLTESVADFARGTVHERPQVGPSRMFRQPREGQLRRLIAQVDRKRQAFVPERGWPLWKLVARCLMLGPAAALRNWYRRLTGSFPIVVLYHHVVTDRPHFMGMSTDAFLRQLDYLHRYYQVVDLETAHAMLRSGKVSAPTVVLTFDDGYKDNDLSLRAASLHADVPATLFICSQRIDAQERFDHDLIRGHDGFPPLTWDEIRDLESYGFHVGAHTRTHFDCGSTDPALLEDELVGARREIEDHLGHPVEWFSFPTGNPRNMSRPAIELARRTYPHVCSAYGGVNWAGQPGAAWHVFRCPHPSSLLE